MTTSTNNPNEPEKGLSNRPSYRFEEQRGKAPEASTSSPHKGDGSIPFTGIPSGEGATKKSTRLSRQQLIAIEERLSARDHAVLMAIRKYRFLTSDQIGRLYIPTGASKSSKTRVQNLLLKRLNDHGLIRTLKRRIGGDGGGSSTPVWYLTEAGHRLLTLNDPGTHSRKRAFEPSALFLKHTLAVAECGVQLTCICRESHDLSLEQVDNEPSCWRRYKDSGKVCYLKPDLFAITGYDNYEDRWFIEMDLGSESTAQIIEKCNAYLAYYYTGVEQKETDMFPMVVWIVKDNARKEKLRSSIRSAFISQPKMFLVITPNELEKMLRQFIDVQELC